jgi:hypothetical protein
MGSVQTFSGRHINVSPDGTIEMSADDAQYMIRQGWTKLAASGYGTEVGLFLENRTTAAAPWRVVMNSCTACRCGARRVGKIRWYHGLIMMPRQSRASLRPARHRAHSRQSSATRARLRTARPVGWCPNVSRRRIAPESL